MCGASEKPMMMSGPAPEFEVTAVCWLMSSQPTKSTLTSTPLFSVNLAALARNTSSSALTKRTGRSIFNDAPFSIAKLGAGTSAALICEICAEAPVAAKAAAETPSASASRRVMLVMISSGGFCCRCWPSSRGLTVRTPIHADRLPAAQCGILQHRGVDAAHRPQSLQHQRQLVADAAFARLVEPRRRRRDMRGQRDILHAEHRIVVRRWLRLQHVERGMGDPAFLQR